MVSSEVQTAKAWISWLSSVHGAVKQALVLRGLPEEIWHPLLVGELRGMPTGGAGLESPVHPTPAMGSASPLVALLKADPASTTEEQSFTLTRNIENATEVSIQPGGGTVPAHGSATVSPSTPAT
ncbi:MAG TPA: hypothetical protein VJQ82_11585 [Terriglobales bacterium]|nr:hypothetical protein [Terriglobales bacterium]